MAVTKAKKISQVETLAVELKDVSNGFIAEYGKLTVAQDDVLRKSIREAGRQVSRGEEHARPARHGGHGI